MVAMALQLWMAKAQLLWSLLQQLQKRRLNKIEGADGRQILLQSTVEKTAARAALGLLNFVADKVGVEVKDETPQLSAAKEEEEEEP